ncbi:formylglycine-generating enzyme family protein [Pleurocapsales cyanobacterium LEGE 06147]|nr:formylglycine-generating enzyme family protein [Pleurocapsales cyanobacterium LEGE 06147]
MFAFDVVTVTVERSGLFGWGSQVKLNRSRNQAQYFTEDLGNGVILEMVSIPGGSFMMGAPLGEKFSKDRERPQHKVTIKPFFMGKFQVTQAPWRAVASLPKINRELNFNPSRFKGDNLPVDGVSWYDAVEFCVRLSKRTGREYVLPSEAEWEYACRAGTTTPFHFGETITTELANYDVKYKKTTPVGQFTPNTFGLHDMHGNVWEWCADTWHESYEGAPIDGSTWLTKNSNCKVLRGGSWWDFFFNCRSAARDYFIGVDHLNLIGFRIVYVVPRT